MSRSAHRVYLDFLETAEKKRRWNIFDDISWDKLDITRDATAQRIELYCSEELYIPDYASRSLELRSGSCRDLAMLRIEAVRSLGMATRFVSGYLHIPGDEEPHAGRGNMQAWAQIYLPGPGWVDFDPSNGIVGNRDLIRVAVVRDPRQATPLHGLDGVSLRLLGNESGRRRQVRGGRIRISDPKISATREVRRVMPRSTPGHKRRCLSA